MIELLRNLLAQLPFVVMRRSTYLDLQRSLTRYRAMRGHMRKDGTPKLPLPREAAEREAKRLSLVHGGEYEVYGCRYCNGMFHTGRRR